MTLRAPLSFLAVGLVLLAIAVMSAGCATAPVKLETSIITRCPAHKAGPQGDDARKMGQELTGLRAKDPKAVTPGVVNDYRRLLKGCAAIEQK